VQDPSIRLLAGVSDQKVAPLIGTVNLIASLSDAGYKSPSQVKIGGGNLYRERFLDLF
jgi:hypothetical protein